MNEQVTSAAELDALPATSAVIWRHNGRIWQKWTTIGGDAWFSGQKLARSAPYVAEHPADVLYRPDQPQRVQPSREDVARLLAHQNTDWIHGYLGADPATGGTHDHGPRCSNWEPYVEDAAAVLALFAQQPTVAEVKAEVDLAELQNERAGVAEAERDALRAVVESVRRWADQIADHFGDEWPHTPACQGEAGCPLCMISEATSDPGEWLAAHDAEVKAEALREAAREFRDRLPDGTGNGRAYNSWRVAQMLDERADRLALQPHEADRIEREARP